MTQPSISPIAHQAETSQFADYLSDVVRVLGPPQGDDSPLHYRLRCPNPDCIGQGFLLSKANGSGYCQDEHRRRSLWEIARILGTDASRIYGMFAGPIPVNPVGTLLAMDFGSLRGLRTSDTTDPFSQALALLQDPWLYDRLLMLAEASGIVGEKDLLRTLHTITASRKAKKRRLHANMREVSGAGKSESVRFALSMLPPTEVLHLGGGASKRAINYYGDLSYMVVFIDEANNLDEDLRAILREAVTKPEVIRLVTQGDPKNYVAVPVTVKTEGMVLIEAGTSVIADPADETRFLILSPDASDEQTDRILDAQAAAAESLNPGFDAELDIWRKAQDYLRICHVEIPFAKALRRLLQWQTIRARRDFSRLLALIAAHACAHQYQRSTHEHLGGLVVEAEVEDYRRVHEFAALIFNQATKGLTRTQEEVLSKILQHEDLWAQFNLSEATGWIGKASSTVREHLQNLEKRGVLESGMDHGTVFWRIVATAPAGVELPDPRELAMALHPQIPQSGTSPSYAQAGTFTGLVSVSIPQTRKVEPDEDVLRI